MAIQNFVVDSRIIKLLFDEFRRNYQQYVVVAVVKSSNLKTKICQLLTLSNRNLKLAQTNANIELEIVNIYRAT